MAVVGSQHHALLAMHVIGKLLFLVANFESGRDVVDTQLLKLLQLCAACGVCIFHIFLLSLAAVMMLVIIITVMITTTVIIKRAFY